MSRHCEICHNEPVSSGVCDLCKAHVIEGPLREAYLKWLEVRANNGRCCMGLSYVAGPFAAPERRAEGNLYFHGKYWDNGYEGQNDNVFVEYGLGFYKDHARTYFLRESYSLADSHEYGDPIPYSLPDFWERVDAQLDTAAEAAYEDGLRSCEHCEYHYYDECGCVEEAAERGEENNHA